MLIRIFVYVVILIVIIFTPLNLPKKTEQKIVQNTTKTISIKIVEPKPVVKKIVTPKITKPKPKKIIKKKSVKKKVIPKKIIPTPPPVVEEKPLVEEKKQEIVEEPLVTQEPVIQTEVLQNTKSSEVDEYFTLIYEEINEKKFYPRKSRRFRQEDTIPVSFVIDDAGMVSSFKILKESEYRELNKAVIKMFKKMRQFPKPPKGLTTPLEMTIEINFNLEER